MIDVIYDKKEIKILTKSVSKLYRVPLRLVITNHVTKKEIWSCDLHDNCWATFPNSEMNDVKIYDKNGLVYDREWDVLLDGDILYKTLYLYCKNILSYNLRPQGLAIGSHDGEFGEWVPCVLDYITDVTLVEASYPQYEKLCKNYLGYRNVIAKHELISTNGKPIEFFEGGRGYTNSVVERVIRNWETEEITSNIRPSISINKLIESTPEKRIDWLHTDVEGYDVDLILSIEDKNLPNLIIYENNNISEEQKNTINFYLTSKGYTLYHEPVSTLALK